jgi:hypothetical protein
MKYILISLLIFIIGAIAYGFYIKSNGDFGGEIIIGISVMTIAFVFMPLFIYHRYKGKDMSSFQLKNFLEKLKEENEKNN